MTAHILNDAELDIVVGGTDNAPTPPPPPKHVSTGVLNGKATSLVLPLYPAAS